MSCSPAHNVCYMRTRSCFHVNCNKNCLSVVFVLCFWCRLFQSNTIVTARKGSLGQGNIFRSVCQSLFCPRGGGLHPDGGSASKWDGGGGSASKCWGVVCIQVGGGGWADPLIGYYGIWSTSGHDCAKYSQTSFAR